MPTTIVSVIAFGIAITLFLALARQTIRAERYKITLDNIDATIKECGKAVITHTQEPIYELGKAEPVAYHPVLTVKRPVTETGVLLAAMRERAGRVDQKGGE